MPHLPLPSVVALLLLLLTGAVAAEEPRRSSDQLHAMPPAEFFALDEVQRPLERGTIDDALLDAAVFHATNRIRAEHDLRPLRHDAQLGRAAEVHVRSMIEHGYLAHENPHDEKLRTPMHRVLATGYKPRTVSENLAQVFRVRYEPDRPYYRFERGGETVFSYEPTPGGAPIPPHTYASLADELLKQWMGSPGHRENVLRADSEELGVAVRFRFKDRDLDEAISVQVFARPRE